MNDQIKENWAYTDGMLTVALSKNIVDVSFIKANGELRSIKCTTNPALIPGVFEPIKDTVSADGYSENKLFKVYETDLNEWRSFHLHSVRGWSV